MRRLLSLVIVPFVVSACGGGSPTTPTPIGPNTGNPPCAVNVQALQINVGATAGPTAVIVSAASNCSWTVTSSQAFLTITSGTGGTGAGTVTFTVAANTGAQRQAIVTINNVQITVTQAAGGPPLALVAPNIPAMVVGVPVNIAFTANGGTAPYTFSLETGVGFPPIGVVLAPNGTLAGTPTAAGAAQFGVCVRDAGGQSVCQRVNVQVAAVSQDPFLGAWSGTIVLRVGCTAPLPSNYPWTGTFSRNAGGALILTVSVPRALVTNEPIPVSVTGQRLTFNIDFDSRYTFVADFSADFRSLTGTFSGGNCNVPPTVVLPSGDWNGTKQ